MEADERLDDLAWAPALYPAGVKLEGIGAEASASATIVAVSSAIGTERARGWR